MTHNAVIEVDDIASCLSSVLVVSSMVSLNQWCCGKKFKRGRVKFEIIFLLL